MMRRLLILALVGLMTGIGQACDDGSSADGDGDSDSDSDTDGDADAGVDDRTIVDGIGAWESDIPEFEQVYHVRPPGQTYGTGDGSSWTNAFSDLPESLERGAAYYLASGDYDVTEEPSLWHGFDDPDEGELFIGIFKATGENHGSDEGWEEAFGQGGAELGPISITTSRYVFDGQLGSLDSGHGFRVSTRDCDDEHAKVVHFPWDSNSQYIAFRHLELAHCGPQSFTDPHDVVYGNRPLQHISFRHCYLHDPNRGQIVMIDWNDVLIDHCYFERNGMQEETHVMAPNGVTNLVVRHSVFRDTNNSFISFRGVENVYFYSNVFLFGEEEWGSVYSAIESLEDARNVKIFNNTFYNLNGLNTGIRFMQDATGCEVYNNLWASCVTNQIMLTGDHGYNAFHDNWREGEYLLDDRIEEPHVQVLTANPFIDARNDDFRLASPTETGRELDPVFAIDPLGNTRGADGVWDRGAFEFVGN